MEAQNRIVAADVSTVLALEAAEEQATKGKAMVKGSVLLNRELKEAREKVLAVQKKLDESTPWVDLLGKKGQRHDIYIIEAVLMLMSLGTTAADACQASSRQFLCSCLSERQLPMHARLLGSSWSVRALG
jgi:hypothetical protein